jgi:predicted alpha/beta superfamily hydrolase
MPSKPATIHASLSRLMKSKYSKRKYRISISLPYAYFESSNKAWPFENPLDKWPVVYLIDANWFFGMVTDIVRNMAWFGNITDAIVVGIGYPDHKDPQEALRDTIARRFCDLSPIRDEAVETWMTGFLKRPVLTGDATAFLNFIKHELIPVIEQDFQINPKNRILAGHSLEAPLLPLSSSRIQICSAHTSLEVHSYPMERIRFQTRGRFAKRHKKLRASHLWAG